MFLLLSPYRLSLDQGGCRRSGGEEDYEAERLHYTEWMDG